MDGLHSFMSSAATARSGAGIHEAASPEGALERARRVAVKLRAGTRRIEEQRELPPDLLEAMHEARLFRLLLPKSLGGDEIDLPTFVQVTETIAAADASAAWCLGQGSGCSMTASFLKPDIAQRLFGPRNAVLAWGAGVQGTAIAVDGGYRVSGQWSFASGSRHATMLGAHCKIVEADGQARMNAAGKQADCTALFSRAKAKVRDVWDVMGLRGTGSDTYEVADLFVAADETLDRESLDKVVVKSALYRLPTTIIYAGGFGGVMLGVVRGTLGDLRTLALAKTQRGASSSMRESQVFQSDLAKMEARYRAARALLHMTVSEVWNDVNAGKALTLDHRINVRLAATHAINEGVDIVAEAYRAAGSSAIFREFPFEQRLRDAHSVSQQVQGRPTHYMTVGRHLLDLPPDSMMFI